MKEDEKFRRQEETALARIEEMDDPDRLETLIENARGMGSERVAVAAFRKRVAVLSGEDHETPVAFDFWRSIHTLEAALTEERGKKTRLARTRLKLTRSGVIETLSDLANTAKPSEGFDLLIARDMGDLTAEAVILRHPQDFDEATRTAAAERLATAGVSLDTVRACDPGY